MKPKITVWKTIRFTFSNLTKNSWMYLRNSLFLQLFISFFGFGLLSLIFKGMLFFAGQANLTFSNFKHVLLNPWMIPFILIYLLAFAFILFLEFSILIFMIYGTIRQTHFSWRTSVKNAFIELRQLLNGHFIAFLLYFITLLPIINLGDLTFISKNIYIPSFITGEITKTGNGVVLYIILILLLLYLHARSSLAIPLQILTDQPFSKNILQSWNITKGNTWRLLFIVGVVEAVLFIFVVAISFLSVALVSLINPEGDNVFLLSSVLTIAKLIQEFIIIYTKMATFIVMTKVIHERKLVSLHLYQHLPEVKHKRKIVTAVALIFVIGNAASTTLSTYAKDAMPDQAIIGHRGYTSKAVENSLEGIKAAKEAGATMVEMDILLTKDHQFVVMHDYNLKRLARLNKRVQDMTLDEIRGLPIYQSEFASHIPTFEEFYREAKDLNIPLIIELKPHGGEPANYVDLFIQKYKELGIDSSNKVMSLDLKVMEELEEKAPEINTGYVIPFQFGGFGNPKVDFFVIEDFSYQELLVLNAQQQGHEVYVWTINSEDVIQKYLNSPVNGIITDEVQLVKDFQDDYKKNNTLMDQFLRALGITLVFSK